MEEIKKELEKIGALNKYAKFVSFNDGVFTFEFNHKGCEHEFGIIHDCMVWDKMKVSELLSLNRIDYFMHTIRLDGDVIGSKLYKKPNIISLN